MRIRSNRNSMSRLVSAEMRYFHRPVSMSFLSCFTAIISIIATLLSLMSYVGSASGTRSYLDASTGLVIALFAAYIIYRILKWGRSASYSLVMAFTAINYIISAAGGFLLSRAIWYTILENSLEGGYDYYVENILSWTFWIPAAVLIIYVMLIFIKSKHSDYDGGFWYLLFVFLPITILALLAIVLRIDIPKEEVVTVFSVSMSVYISIMLSLAVKYFAKAVINKMLTVLPAYEDAVVLKSTYRSSDGKLVQWWEKKPFVPDATIDLMSAEATGKTIVAEPPAKKSPAAASLPAQAAVAETSRVLDAGKTPDLAPLTPPETPVSEAVPKPQYKLAVWLKNLFSPSAPHDAASDSAPETAGKATLPDDASSAGDSKAAVSLMERFKNFGKKQNPTPEQDGVEPQLPEPEGKPDNQAADALNTAAHIETPVEAPKLEAEDNANDWFDSEPEPEGMAEHAGDTNAAAPDNNKEQEQSEPVSPENEDTHFETDSLLSRIINALNSSAAKPETENDSSQAGKPDESDDSPVAETEKGGEPDTEPPADGIAEILDKTESTAASGDKENVFDIERQQNMTSEKQAEQQPEPADKPVVSSVAAKVSAIDDSKAAALLNKHSKKSASRAPKKTSGGNIDVKQAKKNAGHEDSSEKMIFKSDYPAFKKSGGNGEANGRSKGNSSQYPAGFCGKCGNKIAANTKTCDKCGATRSARKNTVHPAGYCGKCGSPISEGGAFCGKCGKKHSAKSK